MDALQVARIQDGTVINLEVADNVWISENPGLDGLTFVVYADDNPAHIGLSWSEEEGFEQPKEPDYPLPTDEEMALYLAEGAE